MHNDPLSGFRALIGWGLVCAGFWLLTFAALARLL